MIRHGLAAAIVATVIGLAAGPGRAAPVDRSDMGMCDRVVEQPADSNVEVCCWDYYGGNTMCIICTKGTNDCESFDPQVRTALPPHALPPKGTSVPSAPLTEAQ